MKFGVNTFLFTSPFNNDSVALFPLFKEWGFDSVEIALEDASHIDPVFVKRELDINQLKCGSICLAMGPGRDLRGTSEEQNASINYIKGVLDIMPILDCPILVGPLYSSVGRAKPETKENYNYQWDMVVAHLRTLSKYAGQLNLKIAIEPLNRYETDFINTCEQGLKLINDIDDESMMLHLDTYHMNIEEKNPVEALIKAGEKLGHFHACGCDRGTPGKDQINWKPISAALKQINYKGDVVIESFTPDVKVIARAASIWRKIEPSQEDIAIDGLQFLKSII